MSGVSGDLGGLPSSCLCRPGNVQSDRCLLSTYHPDSPLAASAQNNRSAFLGQRYQAGFKFITGRSVIQFSAHKGCIFLQGGAPHGKTVPGSVPGVVEPGPGDSSWDGPMKQSSGVGDGGP